MSSNSPILDEPRIERYARQILLPEVGPAGQRRLLGSCVEIRGAGEAVRLCAAWLAGAGIGRIALPDERLENDPLVTRNPDCRLERDPLPSADVRIGIGRLPGEPRKEGALVWGGVSNREVRWARIAARRGCPRCRELLPAVEDDGGIHAALVASILATEAIRFLLGLATDSDATLERLDLADGHTVRQPFPFRCKTCRTTP